jgi:hypothetical protein
MNKRTKKFRNMGLAVILCAAILVCQGGLLWAGRCEDALLKCASDTWVHQIMGGPLFCAVGYLFCLKYLPN